MACLFSAIGRWGDRLYDLAMQGEAREAAKEAAAEKKATRVAGYKEKYGTRVPLPRAAKAKNAGPGGAPST